MREFSTEELCRCVRREIGQRKKVYRRLVEQQKMEPEEAQKEIRMMEVILEKLEGELQLRLF